MNGHTCFWSVLIAFTSLLSPTSNRTHLAQEVRDNLPACTNVQLNVQPQESGQQVKADSGLAAEQPYRRLP